MSWAKENYGKVALIIISLLATGASVFLYLSAATFQSAFANLSGTLARGEKLPEIPFDALRVGKERLDQPAQWIGRAEASLLVANPHMVQVVDGEETLVNPLKPGSPPIHPPVENEWFAKHGIDILSPNILSEDTDGDKFSNLEEWKHGTNPRDPASAPPPHLLLVLKREDRKSNRLEFRSYTEDVFTINTVDVRQPTQFLQIGDEIRGTPFVVERFERKTIMRDLGGSQVEADVSELTIKNEQTGQELVLVLGVRTDAGESTVILGFRYDDSEIRLKRDETFTLPPRNDVTYRLVETRLEGAVIVNTTTGEKIVVPPASEQADQEQR
ncbi:MAG: Amuc_1099 family pilus-like system protein, partial [Verrucomicrobiia bacterium]